MITIRDTATAICQVHLNGYVISEPSRSPASRAQTALFVLNVGDDVLYVYERHIEAWHGPITGEYEALAQLAREQRAAILQAQRQAGLQAAARERARLNAMPRAQREAWLAEYGPGSVDEA